jgi:UTP--glucose-1-phosphate uridylyltransferase
MDLDAAKSAIERKMREKGIHPTSIEQFLEMAQQVGEGAQAYVDLSAVEAPGADMVLDPGDSERRELAARGGELLQKAVVIKLNGGRSTTMGGEVPKGIIACKEDLSYLDIVARQILALRREFGVEVKLCLMNSFFTHDRSMEKISRYDLDPMFFMQSKAPRLDPQTLVPIETGGDEDWAPPGHGDLYRSLEISGVRSRLLEQGYKWAFVSNMDNLAATLEPWILGLIDQMGIDFLLEVTKRTEVDRKGGALVMRNGSVELLEIAQVAPHQTEEFMDIDRFRVFNTNNLWLDLEAMDASTMSMPIIQNRKTNMGAEFLQLETAMGAAIGSFKRAKGLLVGRDRFFPTKKVQDLFVVLSDACVLDEMFRLQANPLRPGHLPMRPMVNFSTDFARTPKDFQRRFEAPGTVSLLDAEYLEVSGNVFFERDVKIKGRVIIDGTNGQSVNIKRGAVLEDCRAAQ